MDMGVMMQGHHSTTMGQITRNKAKTQKLQILSLSWWYPNFCYFSRISCVLQRSTTQRLGKNHFFPFFSYFSFRLSIPSCVVSCIYTTDIHWKTGWRIPVFLGFAYSIKRELPSKSLPCRPLSASSASACSSKVTKANPFFKAQRLSEPNLPNSPLISSSVASLDTLPSKKEA